MGIMKTFRIILVFLILLSFLVNAENAIPDVHTLRSRIARFQQECLANYEDYLKRREAFYTKKTKKGKSYYEEESRNRYDLNPQDTDEICEIWVLHHGKELKEIVTELFQLNESYDENKESLFEELVRPELGNESITMGNPLVRMSFDMVLGLLKANNSSEKRHFYFMIALKLLSNEHYWKYSHFFSRWIFSMILERGDYPREFPGKLKPVFLKRISAARKRNERVGNFPLLYLLPKWSEEEKKQLGEVLFQLSGFPKSREEATEDLRGLQSLVLAVDCGNRTALEHLTRFLGELDPTVLKTRNSHYWVVFIYLSLTRRREVAEILVKFLDDDRLYPYCSYFVYPVPPEGLQYDARRGVAQYAAIALFCMVEGMPTFERRRFPDSDRLKLKEWFALHPDYHLLPWGDSWKGCPNPKTQEDYDCNFLLQSIRRQIFTDKNLP